MWSYNFRSLKCRTISESLNLFDKNMKIASLGDRCAPYPNPMHNIRSTDLAIRGTVVRYHCQEGYYYDEGHVERNISCTSDLLWSDQVPQCTGCYL